MLPPLLPPSSIFFFLYLSLYLIVSLSPITLIKSNKKNVIPNLCKLNNNSITHCTAYMYYKYDYFRYDRKGVVIRICRETCPGCCIFVPATKTVDTYCTVNQLLTTNCHISTNKTKFNPKWSKMCFCKYSTVGLNILKNFSHNF